ncbi:RNA methyltransferase [Hwanghaeella grinnelliae]|uniref:tRNA (cytidine/uridine-2'-O-)-methyltransferase TrmJ n=1 Tax=Hwanghaeella grinnelliae TaxID=2500179 RepID=A0A3S2Z5Z5_9PROT|nr:RNA methyltransferase [Hwanghaeella grinnelliae]RVU34918.1 RNA methyltransferase [Hwanghaeella grinnelliae]
MAGTDSTQLDGLPDGGPVIILVKPQLGQNIGMVARAMLNNGLAELRLVAPRDGWPNPEAVASAAGADRVIDNAQVFETTADAVADLQRVYATTARPRDMVGRVLTPRTAGREFLEVHKAGNRYGVLFGGERAGLDNEDVTLADNIIEAPLNPSFRSLNLAQAVLLISYEWYQNRIEVPEERFQVGDSDLAGKDELLNFLTRLEASLDKGGFFKSPNLRPVTVRNIRNMFQRASLTSQEVRTLHGIAEALRRAGRLE